MMHILINYKIGHRLKLVALLSVLLFSSVYSQIKTLQIDQFSISEGLSNTVVNAITQDDYGFIWIGTDDGLNKFDGYNFKTYRNNKEDSLSLSSSYVLSVLCDSKSRLWVGTDRGLNLYNSEFDCFQRIIPDQKINTIVEDKYGNVYVGCVGGLRIIENNSDTIIALTISHGLPENEINNLYADREQNIITSTSQNLFYFSFPDLRFHPILTCKGEEIILSLSIDIQGFLWMATNRKLFKIDIVNDFKILQTIPFSAFSFINGEISSLFIDLKNQFWLGTSNNVYLLDFDLMQADIVNILDQNLSVENSQLMLFYEDKTGNFWLSLYGQGVFLSPFNKNYFQHYVRIPYYNKSLSHSIVACFEEDNNGFVWIGTWGGGLCKFNPQTKEIERFEFSDPLLNNEVFRGLCFQEPSILWLASNKHGMIKLDLESGNFERFRSGYPNDNFIDIDNLYTVFESISGQIYAGAANGLAVYSDKRRGFINLDSVFIKSRLTAPTYVRVIEEDKYGNLWLGTHGFGAVRFNPIDSSLITYHSSNSSPNTRLNNNIIYFIHEDKRGLIWIGTMGGGLNIFNPFSGRMLYVTDKIGLPNNVVNGVLSDENDNMWISTNSGLCRFSVPGFFYSDTLTNTGLKEYDLKPHFVYYDEDDGIQSKEFKYGACFSSSQGKMYFGGVNGFNVFEPSDIEINTLPPEIYITELKVNNERQLPALNNAILKFPIIDTDEIKLKYNQDFLSINFVAINYNNPSKNQYKYILHGFDEQWNYTNSLREANYMNLDPGEYIFEVFASNNDGVWSEKGRKLNVIIEPPLWGKLWFQILFIVIILSILFSFYRYRLYLVKQNNIILESKVNKRTQELKNTNLLLEEQKNELEVLKDKMHDTDQAKLRFFTTISHEFRTPLTLIVGPLEKLFANKELSEKIRSQLSSANRNAQILLQLINQLLDFRKLDTGNVKLRIRETDLISFIKSITSLFEYHARQRGIKLEVKAVQVQVMAFIDTVMMEKVIYNMLSNAFKYTSDKGNIVITVDQLPKNNYQEQIRICIEDDGKGIPEEHIEHVFNRFYQVEKSPGSNQFYGSGIGLALSMDYVELHKGKISIEKGRERGSKFIIHLMPGKEHFCADELILEDQLQDVELKLSAPEFAKEPLLDQESIISEDSSKEYILCIDDNPDILRYLEDIFSANYNVLLASDAAQGKEKAFRYLPDLIICDIMIPGSDGIILTRLFKADPRTDHIPILILSALASEDEKLEGLKSGADDYVTKPFSAKLLEARADAIIHNRKSLFEKFTDELGFNPGKISRDSPDKKFLSELTRILNENLANEEFNTTELSRQIGLSRAQLYRKISSVTGQSPSYYIRSYKMRKAAILLDEGKYNVSEVAFQLGFKSLSHFTKTFTAIHRLTPTQYLSRT